MNGHVNAGDISLHLLHSPVMLKMPLKEQLDLLPSSRLQGHMVVEVKRQRGAGFLVCSASALILLGGLASCKLSSSSRDLVGTYHEVPTIRDNGSAIVKSEITISKERAFSFDGFAGTISNLDGPKATVAFPAPNFIFDLLGVPKGPSGDFELTVERISKDQFWLTGGSKIWRKYTRSESGSDY